MDKATVMAMSAGFIMVIGLIFLLWAQQAVAFWSQHRTDYPDWVALLAIGFILAGFGFGMAASLPVVYQLEKKAGKS